MYNRKARLSAIFVIFAAMEAPAFAYLDGATGSIILQAAIGLFASWAVYYRTFRERARGFFARIGGKAPADTDGQ
jgi:hypothetical protein